ncbi:hypothetical protein HY623_01775 [Candidatus Uhrbacteria bacterium]|nr:hypothetical protein [Candidatus Uhrbacteria bacterium]
MAEQNTTLEEKVDGLVTTVGDLSQTVDGLVTTVGDLSQTVDGLVTTVGDLAVSMDELARMIKGGFDAVDKRFDAVEKDVGQLKTDVSGLKTDVGYLKSQMVTKEYLDKKLGDLWGDVIVLFRKEDKRVSGIVSVLEEKAVFSSADVQQLDKLRPLVVID